MTSYIYSVREMKLRADCEEGFAIGPLSNIAFSPTGEPFDELINFARVPAASEEDAYVLALDAFREYAADKTGTLYWRVYPEVSFHGSSNWLSGSDGGWTFYMRVLISDLPQKYQTLAVVEEMR